MKLISVFLLTLLPFLSFSQEPLTFTDVVQTDSVSKEELFLRAKEWFSEAYNDANSVLQHQDKEDGVLIGKGAMPYDPTVFMSNEQTRGKITYTIKIFLKDGRYKYEITDFIHDPRGNQYGKSSFGLITTDKECPRPKPMAKNWSNKVWDDIQSQIDTNMKYLITSLLVSMASPAEVENDDW